MEYIDSFNIDDIKRKMLIKYPFFGSAVASLRLKEVKGLGTAGTDGKTVYYDPEFLSKLSSDEQSFIFAHEICHIAFNHILRSEGKDSRLWNIATDAVINQFLKKDGLPLVEGGVDIEDALNYDAERLYEKLLREEKEQQPKQENGQQSQSSRQQSGYSSEQNQEQSQGNQNQESKDSQSQSDEQTDQKEQSSNSSAQISDTEQKKEQHDSSSGSVNDSGQEKNNEDVGHDTHSMWEHAVKRYKETESFDKEDEKENQNQNSKTQEEIFDEKLKETQEKLFEMGEKKAFKKNEQTRKEQLQELLDALSRESMVAGSTTNSEKREIKDIGISKPLIDWRLWLREAVSMDVDWSFANAEIDNGVVTPNLETYPIPETEILLDTSGSIHENLLKNFLRECKNIFQTSSVKVGCFDTRFYGWNEVRTLDDIDNIEYRGGGGTNFNAAVNAFTKRVENKIIFTDGEAPMPNTPVNAIWIVFGGKKINPVGGKVIHITDDQLRKLCYETEQKDNHRRMK